MGKTSTGLQENVASMLCYLAGWITGLVFYLIEKENKVVRFHAMQSIIVFGAWNVLGLFFIAIPILGWLLLTLLNLAGLGVWVFLMIKAYQGEKIKFPIAGDIAENNI